jgi:CRISPR/Cas system-associated endonuclease Cas1
MKYYKEAQTLKQQQKHIRRQQQRIEQAKENMEKSISQISCRTLRYCKNEDTKKCMYCKWNQTCITPEGDYYTPKIPGLKVLP